VTTRTFLYTLPAGTSLPTGDDLTNAAQGSPFLLQDGQGGVALYAKIGDAYMPAAAQAGSGGGTQTPWPDYIFTGTDGRRWRQTVDASGQVVMVETTLPGTPIPPADVVVD
jgi:hypothetical protein